MSVLGTARFTYFHTHHNTGTPENVSTWVDYPNSLFDPEEGHRLDGHHLRIMRLAEEFGYDGVPLKEHQLLCATRRQP